MDQVDINASPTSRHVQIWLFFSPFLFPQPLYSFPAFFLISCMLVAFSFAHKYSKFKFAIHEIRNIVRHIYCKSMGSLQLIFQFAIFFTEPVFQLPNLGKKRVHVSNMDISHVGPRPQPCNLQSACRMLWTLVTQDQTKIPAASHLPPLDRRDGHDVDVPAYGLLGFFID